MDKKYTLIGILFLLAAAGLMFFGPKQQPPPQVPVSEQNQDPSITPAGENQGTPPESNIGNPPGDAAQVDPNTTITPSGTGPTPAAAAPTAAAAAPWINDMFAPLEPPHADEQVATLSNDFIEVRLTNYGGAISSVALKKHLRVADGEDPLVLNAQHHAPILAFSRFGGADFATRYEQVSANASEVVYRTVVLGQLEITRTYRINYDGEELDPYVIRSATTLRNLTSTALNLPKEFAVNLGTGELVHDSDDAGLLTVGRFDGKKLSHSPRSALDYSSGFLGMFGGHPEIPFLINDGPTAWATLENQFFATIITPEKPGTGVTARRVELPDRDGGLQPRYGLVGELRLESHAVAPNATETLNFDVYAGPKEYKRLARLGEDCDEVMGWGFLGSISKILLLALTATHSVVGNWGLAIVLTTVVLRGILWPLTGIQTRAAKRMAKIQVPLKELQEKYKDNRQKLTEETMKLWKTHKVNPVAGCLPLLVQMPIFIGWFTMLRTAAELRFGQFLWIGDLSAPDTVLGPLPGFSLPLLGPLALNIMPLLMGASMMVQMRLSPTPTTDNAQAKMMKFMPVMMVVFCYNFSSGLSLYWTTSNLFTIFQQWVTNRSKDPVDAITPGKPGAADRAKPVRDAKVSNVRDGKKKKR